MRRRLDDVVEGGIARRKKMPSEKNGGEGHIAHENTSANVDVAHLSMTRRPTRSGTDDVAHVRTRRTGTPAIVTPSRPETFVMREGVTDSAMTMCPTLLVAHGIARRKKAILNLRPGARAQSTARAATLPTIVTQAVNTETQLLRRGMTGFQAQRIICLTGKTRSRMFSRRWRERRTNESAPAAERGT